MPRKKIAFTGSGKQWFPMLSHFIGSKDRRGPFFDMSPNAELRLYFVLVFESHQAGSTTITLTNQYVREFTGLNRNYLAPARDALVERGLIHADKAGKEAYQYEICGRKASLAGVSTIMLADESTFFEVPTTAERQADAA